MWLGLSIIWCLVLNLFFCRSLHFEATVNRGWLTSFKSDRKMQEKEQNYNWLNIFYDLSDS